MAKKKVNSRGKGSQKERERLVKYSVTTSSAGQHLRSTSRWEKSHPNAEMSGWAKGVDKPNIKRSKVIDKVKVYKHPGNK